LSIAPSFAGAFSFILGLIFAKGRLLFNRITKAMHPNLNHLDLESVRNLFLKETREYLVALNYESAEDLKTRKEWIDEIEKVLEAKKRLIQISIHKKGF
jgi:hypothetical protein